MARPLSHIAQDILRAWPKPSVHALPYIRAMHACSAITDMYGADTAESVVRYFLANAGTWRGETARNVKAELNAMLRECEAGRKAKL
jgi:hypothetical protein